MSVAPIGANALTLVMSIDANAFALALVVLELSEGKNQQPQQRERNHNKGITTALPWWVVLRSSDGCRCASVMSVALIVANGLALPPSDLTEGNEPAATTEGKESTTRE